MARQGPASVWIELTSKCPLRCVFCSRENLRGEGQHMDPVLLENLLRSLERPEIIRLNYSGESANYPWLMEAIAKTRALTRAQTEMVTSLVSMPMETVCKLPGSGIDRISISLHSLDRKTFPILYGGGTLDGFERRLKSLLRAARQEIRPPAIDFAFVAMDSNVAELGAIASLAGESGAMSLLIHPVIRRAGVPAGFEREAREDGKLTEAFQTALDANVAAARDANPGVRISVARPPDRRGGGGPFTCEQNPFETVHVLANGDVVACEVMDRKVLGNIASAGLRKVWEGEGYREFRTRYVNDEIPECRGCIFRAPVLETGAIRTCWGWHDRDESGVLWSRTACSFECETSGQRALVLKGLLPADVRTNSMRFVRDGQEIATVCNKGSNALAFRVELALDGAVGINHFAAFVEHGFSPWRRGLSNDSRELGFALFNAELSGRHAGQVQIAAPRFRPQADLSLNRSAVALLFGALGPLERMARMRGARAPVQTGDPDDSLAVLIPERGGAPALGTCLAALEIALARVSIRSEVCIVVNGSKRADYAGLMRGYPGFRFLFVSRPLGFTSAIRMGLRDVTAGWTYLLNSDMWLDEDALAHVLRQRTTGVFSLASRIRMTNKASARETNRTGIEFIDGLANLLELDGATGGPVEHFYSGGGSSLFQTAWLRFFADQTTCYDPFYWEDAEWGVRARAAGMRNLFVPDSTVQHVGRATVSRFYEASEVSRIFERNRIQFQLRCVPGGDISVVRERLAGTPHRTVIELLHPFRLVSMARARALPGCDIL